MPRILGVRRPLVAVVVLAMALAVVFVLMASPASAAEFTESYTDSFGPADTDWSEPLTFPQFDPAMGDLTKVTIEYGSSLAGSMGAENFSTTSTCDVTLEWGANVSLDTLDGLLTSALGQIEGPVALDLFDGTIDFGGPSGVTFEPLFQADSQSKEHIDPGVLALFTGLGTVDLPAAALGDSVATGCGTVTSFFLTQATVEVTLTYTFEVEEPAIDIEKFTNGEPGDSDSCVDGPTILVGDPVEWTYVVTNPGDVPLANVVVTDDQLGIIAGPDSGDDNGNGLLDPGETWIYTATGVVQAGDYRNLGDVSGVSPGGATVIDDDPSCYFGADPQIDIEKATNGEDADTPTGPSIPVGDPVTWTYVVTNTGNVDLVDVEVVDNLLGQICVIPSLPVGASDTCTASGVAEPGQYANLGTSTGIPPVGPPVFDEDPSHYVGVAEFEGCTPGYWKQRHHFGNWVTYERTDQYEDVFGVPYEGSLIQALRGRGGAEIALGRHSVAALLNAANPDVTYAYGEAEIIALVQDAWATGDFRTAKNLLAYENERGCDLGRAE